MLLQAGRVGRLGLPIRNSAFSPARLFAAGEVGAWYDPSDFSRYMATGPELVVNGTFATDTDNWTASTGTFVSTGGQGVLTSGALSLATQSFPTTVGATYVFEGEIAALSGGAFRAIRKADNAAASVNALTFIDSVGFTRQTFVATSTTTFIVIQLNGTSAGNFVTVDRISVREVPAISTATLFQDSAGTTPVTAVEQPVGLMLDKSRGLVPGAELVSNGDFSSGTGWSAGAGWTIGSGVASFNGTASALSLSPGFAYTAGEWFQVALDKTGNLLGSLRLGTSVLIIEAARTGRITGIVQAPSTGSTVFFYGDAGTGTLDNITIKRLPGNHASQSTTTARPVLSARVNLLTATENFADATWSTTSIVSGTVTRQSGFAAPDGTNTAWRLTFSAADTEIRSPVGGVPAGALHRFWIKGTAGQTIVTGANSGATVTLTGGWQEISGTATQTYFWIGTWGSMTARVVDVWHPDVRVANESSLIPAYQRVTTATDYDTAGFPVYLRAQTDDCLFTGNINFSSTDKMTVFAGVRKLVNTPGALIAELGNVSAGGWYLMPGNFTNAVGDFYTFLGRGTASETINQAAQAASAAPPTSDVITASGDIAANSNSIRIDAGVTVTGTASQGTGNYGNYPLFLFRRNNATLPFDGRCYGIIVRGAATNAGDISATERWLAAKSGVVLP